jgi:hypothetical protein
MGEGGIVMKALINTIMRLVPIALYAGTVISGSLFSDFRGLLLFFGLVLNEIISLGYNMYSKMEENPQCALLRTDKTYFNMPSSVTQTVGFFVGFIISDMYNKGEFAVTKFISLLAFLILAIFSQINTACMDTIGACLTSFIGFILGIGYYLGVKSYYNRDYLIVEDRNVRKYKKDFTEIDDFFKLD